MNNTALVMNKISQLPIEQRQEIIGLLEELEEAKAKESSRTDFITFVKRMWPSFIAGRHHSIMSDAFERVANGELKRLIINMPPRHTKSEFASYLFPAWFLGRYPEKKIIQTAHTAELAVGFGRKVRNLIKKETTLRLVSAVQLLVKVLTFSLLTTHIRNRKRHWGLTTQMSMTKFTSGTRQGQDKDFSPEER